MSKTYRSPARTRENRRYHMLKKNPDAGKTIALVALGGAAVYAAYILIFKKGAQQESIPFGLKVTSYKNKETGAIAEVPDPLTVYPGQTVIVNAELEYYGKEQPNAGYHVALARGTDEVAAENHSFVLPASEESVVVPISGSVKTDTPDFWDNLFGTGWDSEVFDIYIKLYNIVGSNLDVRVSGAINFVAEGGGEVAEWELAQTITNLTVSTEAGAAEWALCQTITSLAINPEEEEEEWTLEHSVTYLTVNPTTSKVSFKMSIWGIPNDFGSYDHWSCYYFPPGASWVSDQKWYTPSSKISFSNVTTGGYVAVIFAKGSVASNYYYSPVFTAVNNGIYRYDVQLNRISKIG